jgi:predicted lipoprotein with Yx(FWY)xxD motif
MKRIAPLFLIAAIAALGVFTATAVAHRSARAATLSIRKTALGSVLVDPRGHTLYLFKKDRRNKSACAASCAKFWPPLLARSKPRVGAGLRASLVGMTRRSNGSLQVTYNGHPLYSFVLDKAPGQAKGEGLLEFGAKWYALSARGNAVVKASSPPVTTSTASSTTSTTCFYPPC